MTLRIKAQVVLVLASLLGGWHALSAQQSGEAKLGTPITGLPYTITQPGVYVLQQDFLGLTMASGVAIQINASDVVLDFNGHTLKNTATAATCTAYGVMALDRSNVTVRHGSVQGFMSGVALVANNPTASTPVAYGNLVESVEVSSCFFEGIALSGSSSIVRRCQVNEVGGSAVLGSSTGAYGIDLAGKGLRCLDCDVASGTAGGVDGASYAIYLAQSSDAMVVKNRLGGMDYGICFDAASSGLMRANLFTGLLKEDFVGGTDVGGNVVDSNSDGVDDDWEIRYFGTTNVDLADDPFHSGLTNLEKYQRGLNPLVASTAGDGFTDGWKVYHGLNPHHKIVTDTNGAILALQVFTPLNQL